MAAAVKLGPLQLPTTQEDMIPAYNEILQALWYAIEDLQNSLQVVQHKPPDKVREGMYRLADGTDWDPGSGAGLYLYLSGAWVKL